MPPQAAFPTYNVMGDEYAYPTHNAIGDEYAYPAYNDNGNDWTLPTLPPYSSMVDNWELPSSFPNYHGLTSKLEGLAQTLPSYDNALSTIGAIPDAINALNGAPAPDNFLLFSLQAIGLTLGLGATTPHAVQGRLLHKRLLLD